VKLWPHERSAFHLRTLSREKSGAAFGLAELVELEVNAFSAFLSELQIVLNFFLPD